MDEKRKLFENLVEKSSKSQEELEHLVNDKVNELSGLVSEEGAIYIIANELGIKLESDKSKKEADFLKIESIKEPKTPVSLYCKVLKKYDKINFTSSKGNEGSVQSLLVGDETGISRLTFWNDQTEVLDNIHEKDILKIINAYTRENTQNTERIDIHYGQYSDIEVNPSNVEINVIELKSNIEVQEKKISELEENQRNIKIKATITDFDIPRFYLACPECFKKVFQDEGSYRCAQHDIVEAMKVPIVNFILDDGSSSITSVGFRDRAEDMTELKTEEIISLTEDIEKYRTFSKKIIGSSIELVGNVSLSTLTGEKQILANQIISLNLKSIDDIAEELVEESKQEKQSNSEQIDDSDDLDLEIEEIDLDDDLL